VPDQLDGEQDQQREPAVEVVDRRGGQRLAELDDWIRTVPRTPTLSPTQGWAAKANMLCAASLPSPANPRLMRPTAQISR
jgi:hypothetical protein